MRQIQEMKMSVSDNPKSLARLYQDICADIGGCTDGNCLIVRPEGMHTNGGCKCWVHMNKYDVQRLTQVAQRLAASVLTPPLT